MPWDIIIVGAIVIAVFIWEVRGKKVEPLNAKELLAANDKLWNQLLIKHQKAIAEAYAEGRPFQIDIER